MDTTKPGRRGLGEVGLLVLRLGIGISFLAHGGSKIIGGPSVWEEVGKAMGSLGIDFFPVFWGFLAAVSELGGGILLILGLFTSLAALLMAVTMTVATMMHLGKGDPYETLSHPLEMGIVFVALILMGGGRFSMDHRRKRKLLA